MSKMIFGRLFTKESKGLFAAVAIFTALVVFWHLFLLTRFGVWTQDMVLALAFIPAFILPAWTVGMAVYNLHTEWTTNTIYQLLALPVRGWKVVGAKLAATLTGFTVLSAIGLVSYWLFFGRHFLEMIQAEASVIPFQWLLLVGFQAYLGYWFFTAMMVVLVQFAYLAGRLAPKYWSLAAGATFLISLWLMARLGAVLTPLFEWVPDISFRNWVINGNVAQVGTETVSSAPLAVILLFTIGFFLLGGWMFEREMEV